MTIKEYQDLYDNDAPEIIMDDDFILVWVNNIVDALNVVVDGSYELHYGKIDDRDNYEHHIEPCMPSSFKEYHIYRGIDKLAEVCGEKLQKVTDRGEDRYPIKRYFYYKGIKFFELNEIDEDGVINDKHNVPERGK